MREGRAAAVHRCYRVRRNAMELRTRGIGLLGLSLLAVLVGMVTGFGAVFFRD